MFLQVDQLHKSFQNTQVLKGVSFSLKKGQVLSIIGASGSGKTTLLRCLNFLETPDSGSILLNDIPLFNDKTQTHESDEDLRIKRLHFGLVFQQFNLFPQYTVLRNITLAIELLQLKSTPRSARAKLKTDIELQSIELLDRVGLHHKMNAYPNELSGGQQQRVAIARALALKPDILCFDEPTSALDPELTGEVLRVIKGLKSADSTMIIVTHEMEFAAKVSDMVIFMADGIIEEYGTPEEVMLKPKSAKTQAFLKKVEV